MRRIRRILVALKEPAARRSAALAKAAQLARAFGAELELFHGITAPLYVDAYRYEPGRLRAIKQLTRTRCLAQLEAAAASCRGVEIHVSAEWDFPAYEAILRRASRIGADLIVAEQHIGRRIAPSLLHLTDWELLRMSPIPVLLVKSARAYEHPVILAAIDPGHAYAKPAKLDDRILSASRLVARALRGTLHAVHAYLPEPLVPRPREHLGADWAELTAQSRSKAQAALDRAVRKASIPTARRHLVVGWRPADAIREATRTTHSAIVVMGAVSRSGLNRVFIGNTAEQLLGDLRCDVLVIKPAHFGRHVGRARRGPRLVSNAFPLAPY